MWSLFFRVTPHPCCDRFVLVLLDFYTVYRVSAVPTTAVLPLRVCEEVAQRGDVKGLGRGRRRRRSWAVAVAPLVKRGVERVVEALVKARLQGRYGGDIGEISDMGEM